MLSQITHVYCYVAIIFVINKNGTDILKEDDDVFNSTICAAGTCGIIYSFVLYTTEARFFKQLRILTSYCNFKDQYRPLLDLELHLYIWQMKHYLSPYEVIPVNINSISNDYPVTNT